MGVLQLPIIDSQQRELSYLRLSVTELCNFRCNYCLPNGIDKSQLQPELNLGQIKILVATFAELGFKKIRLTGGEPALRKDLLSIIAICKNQPGIEKVCISTNGYQLKKNLPLWIAAGIDQVNISIDSFSEKDFQLITSSNALPDILHAIDHALEQGFYGIKINSVLLREQMPQQNIDALNWLKPRPLSLRFIELMQTGDNQNYFNKQHFSGQTLKQNWLKQGWQQAPKKAQAGPAQDFHHKDYAGRIGLIAPYQQDFCQQCNRVRVSASGKLHLCLFAEQGFDLTAAIAQGKQALMQKLVTLFPEKPKQHYLQQANSGAITHFSMIGG